MTARVTETEYQHAVDVAAQLDMLYVETDKLAKKKPAEPVPPLILKKIDRVIGQVREIAGVDDSYMTDIEPLTGEQDSVVRFDEAVVVLADLKGALRREWGRGDIFEFLRYTYHISMEKRYPFDWLKP